jgi:lipoprotein-anchoring transpeptidase ErfK/SrfK
LNQVTLLAALSLLVVLLAACTTTPAEQSFAQEPFSTATAAVTATATATATTPPTMTATLEPTETPIPPTSTPEPTLTPTPEPPPPTATPAPAAPTPTDAADTTVILNGDPAWHNAIHTTDGAYMGVVTAQELNVRSGPSLDASILTTTYARHPVSVYEVVTNPDDGGEWYRIGDGRYVSASLVEPFIAPPPAETFTGHWVDVNLSSFYAIAYDGDTPVYAAIITAGREDRTPPGVYHIFYRVEDETMDSATVGIPKGSPEYYYLEHVMYTQYFKEGGFALHGNYWTAPDQFGQYSSNGCVGLMNADAAWFWTFLSDGSMVSIHY